MRVLLNPTLNAFEQALLDALLAGSLELLEALRAQLEAARILSRELSGAGFFLKFHVSANAARVEPKNFEISDVLFELEGLEHGGGALLFVRDGVITMLEGYSHAGGWPEEPREFVIRYFDGTKRDLAKVATEISNRGRSAD